MATQILIWWIAVQLLGLAGLPLASLLFRALPDRGYAFGKTLGLLLTGYLAWLLAMLGLAPFGPALIVLSALAVVVIGLLAVRRRSAPAGTGTPASLGITATPAQSSVPLFAIRDTLVPWLRRHWRMVAGYELLFALALVFLALLRSYDLGFTGPNPWGTERPMDYALFNAIRRSATFPPHDPWLAGYSINYYYFGYLLMAVVALLSGLEPAVAYNMSLALIFALTALGVAGIVANLIALTLRDERPTTNDEPEDKETRRQGDKETDKLPVSLSPGLLVYPWSVLRGLAVVLSVVLVLFAANQGAALQIITGSNMAVALDGGDLVRAIANGLGERAPLRLDPPFKGDYFDGTSVITPTDTIKDFNWWNPSRAVWDDFTRRGDPSRHYTITEFPFFSFWLGDMHPHVMALPFGLLALALALQTLTRPAAPLFTMGRRGWLELALTGIVLGSLYMINSWDFPTYVLLFLGALLLLYIRLGAAGGPAQPEQPTSEVAESFQARFSRVWWQHYAGQAISALLAAVVLFAPFHLTFRSLVAGRGFPLGLVTWSRTPLHSFLIIFGLFLLPLVVYVFAQGRRARDTETRRHGDTETPRHGDLETPRHGDTEITSDSSASRSPGLPVSLSMYLPWVTLAALIVGPLAGFPLLALLPLALHAALLAVERAERPATAFALWAFALGCLVCFGTDVVYIRDTFGTRMNTIFKFYYQTWLIWGVLAGYALWWLFARRTTNDQRPTTKEGEEADRSSFVFRLSSSILIGTLVAVLLAGSLVYPWMTAGRAFREGQRVGLAGKTPREQTPEGAAAIAWLRANAPATAVVLEAVGDAYDVTSQGFAGVSASTGLATVLGWPGHEDQWRGGDPNAFAQITPRKADVETIYTTTDVGQARELLQKYHVGYIYVGAAERALYAPEGLAKLAQLGTAVFQQGDVVIYQVK